MPTIENFRGWIDLWMGRGSGEYFAQELPIAAV